MQVGGKMFGVFRVNIWQKGACVRQIPWFERNVVRLFQPAQAHSLCNCGICLPSFDTFYYLLFP